MKKRSLLMAMVATFLVLVTNILGQELKRYPFKSIKIEYNTSVAGSVMGMGTVKSVGTKTLWVDNYGENEAEYKSEKSETNMMGQLTLDDKEELKLIDNDFVYHINLKDKSGTKMNIKEMKELGKVMATAYMAKDGATSLKEYVEQNNGKWLGEKSFLDRNCEVFEIMGITQWVYKGITIKSEGDIMGMMVKEEAISIIENSPVPKEKLLIPSGITFTELHNEGIYPKNDQLSALPLEPGSIGITYAQFLSTIDEAKISGYSKMSSGEQEGGYMSIYIKSDVDMFIIQALPFTNIDIAEGEEFTTISEKKINERDAKLLKILENEDDIESTTYSLVINYPEYNMKLFIASPLESNIPLLEEIANKLSF